MRITANHAHVFPKELREEGAVSKLLLHMDACGISDCIAFAPFPDQFGSLAGDPCTWLAKEIRGMDRLHGFGVIDFSRDDIAEQVRLIADLGFGGIKLHPAYQHFHLLCDKATQVYEESQEQGLFLSFHTGVHWDRIANYQVLLFDEIAHGFPKLRFSMEHIGGYSFFREALAVLTNNGRDQSKIRVFGGLTSVFEKVVNRLWYLSQEQITEAIAQAGENAFLFGLDFPYNGIAQTKLGIACIEGLPITQQAKEKILGGNLRGLLKIA